MVCRQCGTEIAEKAIICYRCGTATAVPETGTGRRPSRGSLAGRRVWIWLVVAAAIAAAVWWRFR